MEQREEFYVSFRKFEFLLRPQVFKVSPLRRLEQSSFSFSALFTFRWIISFQDNESKYFPEVKGRQVRSNKSLERFSPHETFFKEREAEG